MSLYEKQVVTKDFHNLNLCAGRNLSVIVSYSINLMYRALNAHLYLAATRTGSRNTQVHIGLKANSLSHLEAAVM